MGNGERPKPTARAARRCPKRRANPGGLRNFMDVQSILNKVQDLKKESAEKDEVIGEQQRQVTALESKASDLEAKLQAAEEATVAAKAEGEAAVAAAKSEAEAAVAAAKAEGEASTAAAKAEAEAANAKASDLEARIAELEDQNKVLAESASTKNELLEKLAAELG